MSDSPTEDFLEHYGVKGMHWGKHKSSSAVEVHKPGKAPINKDKLSAARKDLYGGLKAQYSNKHGKISKTKAGAMIATHLLSGTIATQVVGAQMMRSAGYSKGKSLAMGIVGGAPGAALAIELKARKIARA
jgi:hypothetical protein